METPAPMDRKCGQDWIKDYALCKYNPQTVRRKKNNLKIDIKDSTTTANKVKAVILISPLPNTTAEQADKNTHSQDNS